MKVFIDGQVGTTGLQLEGRLRKRSDIQLLEIEPDLRKDYAAKQTIMDQADVIFLCLPDNEAKISAEMAPKNALVIDASTAHRTTIGWAYGLPELSHKHREAIATGHRIAVPGCHACGFNAMVYPLVSSGLLPLDACINCTSLTGYSGGGRSLIETYETNRLPDDALHAPQPYALGLAHKHLPEMKAISGLANPPHFYPVVGDMAQGMLVTIHLWAGQFTKAVSPEIIREQLSKHYQDAYFINVLDTSDDNGFLDPTACNGTNNIDIMVFGHDKQILIAARLDNLGKGASGAAVQCMNIACGLDERTGF
ncbi:MAG: N-acetyl-gamma-glutamyl-phosphate reductase [Defluviitaleaceae bacterium]|nr:N-acetyl-gamma-glutamyl-phosphate reductase [Defluviitaleaceae bacterium]